MCFSAGADGPRGAGDPHPEPSHVQQQIEELQAGGREAGERLCEYSHTSVSVVRLLFGNIACYMPYETVY